MSLDLHTEAPSTPESSTPAPESGAPSVESTFPAVEGAGMETTPDPAALPVYSPNFKFKVMDKEHEFDEFLRPAIKDSETEKKIRELYEKAYGLDVVKPRFNETREKLKSVETTHGQVMSSIAELREHYQRGDFDSFFQALKIPQEKILQWVLDKANYQELPPEQKRIFDDRRSADQRAWEAEKRAQALEQRIQEQTTQAKGYALQVALEKPDVKSFVETFDQRAGRPGAFIEAVVETGDYAWHARNEDLSPEQAIQAVMARYGSFVQAQSQAPQAGNPAQPQTTPTKAPPVIPNVGGRTASPTSQPQVKSLADLKKKYEAISKTT
jgi:hypothetical protein